MTGIFSSKRDAEIIVAGGFFCYACAVGKPIEKQSPDPRYCLSCNDALQDVEDTARPPKAAPVITKDGQGILL